MELVAGNSDGIRSPAKLLLTKNVKALGLRRKIKNRNHLVIRMDANYAMIEANRQGRLGLCQEIGS